MSTPTADSVHKIIDDHYRTYIMPAYERHEEYLEKINKKLNMTESSLESIKRSVSKQEQELEDMKKKSNKSNRKISRAAAGRFFYYFYCVFTRIPSLSIPSFRFALMTQ